ncbi:MAG: DotU family type IV/VI secretion system protein [Ramlibacter sp.]|nr:DotU family type IV/VI secretion system protein [Ramlibacter sp.]
MPAPDGTAGSPALLLGLFADFYEEVARIKQHSLAGTLPDYLADGAHKPATPQEQARAVSARLAGLLLEQNRRMRQHGTQAQLRLHGVASYVMAALADEIFIFELDWAARQAWLSALLEHRLFGSRLAGRRFFEQAEQILATNTREVLQCDLASCFLLAVQLGFKGMNRGAQGAPKLDALRQRLWRFVNGSSPAEYAPVLFPQAYAHTVVSLRDERIAPIAPWLRAAGWWSAGFLAVSSILWLWLVQPLVRLGGGWTA